MFYSPQRIRRNVDKFACLIVLLTGLLWLSGCNSKKAPDAKSQPAKSTSESKPMLVELARVERGMIEEILERSSPLQAESQVQVLARTPNQAVELFVEEGDTVTQGQVLLRLENDRQKTDYQQSLNQLEEARVEFDRLERLYKERLVSESDHQVGNFAFKQAKLRSENTKRELEYTEVRAPIKGTITSRTVKVGDQVATATPIFEIIDLDSTVAVINVPEQYLPKLKPDMEARLISSTLSGQKFSGFVKRISPVVEARAGTIKVVIGVKNLGPLRPGMWVDAELVLDTKQDALLIPKRSIVYDNDQTFAFKLYTDTNGVRRAKRELVVPLNADKDHIEPTKGFAVGDLIVVAGHSGLKDDSPIRELENPATSSSTPISSTTQVGTNSILKVGKTTAQGVD